ncbi:hypothetical protein CERSUDRAFT_96166 [Gelatoporia subvermispora B]|uniref:Uncharacterized protein n=1 Tax=Ceriporiopsis subvermispora (strain B) TaxID=914234 RepID=M2QV56_CERS8|nr:hypothetical protein CERSUDRAFT_96166 [Gelatoporia subvermispora B]
MFLRRLRASIATADASVSVLVTHCTTHPVSYLANTIHGDSHSVPKYTLNEVPSANVCPVSTYPGRGTSRTTLQPETLIRTLQQSASAPAHADEHHGRPVSASVHAIRAPAGLPATTDYVHQHPPATSAHDYNDSAQRAVPPTPPRGRTALVPQPATTQAALTAPGPA